MKFLMMGSVLYAALFLLFIPCSYCLQLCTNSRAPVTLKVHLAFCGYNGSSCCSAADDSAIQKQFKSMNISDAPCASLVQSILCAFCIKEGTLSVYSRDLNESTILWRIKSRKKISHKQMSEHAKIKNTENLHEKSEAKKVTEEREFTISKKNYSDSRMCCDYKCSRKCDPFSGELFTIGPNIRTVPVLCNSTFPRSSSQSKDTTRDYCAQVWDTCKEVSMFNSPFAPSLQGSAGMPVSSSKITDFWQSETDFCKAFGGSPNDQSVCFNGRSALFNSTPDSPSPKGLCLERIGNGSYLAMSAHPDGSNRVFLSNQAGKIWLATVPEEGSAGTLDFDESSPFLDISDEVLFDAEFGVMGLAFHPNFTSNGRFFVSYNCDKVQSVSCSGRCACNSDAGCDPSKLGTSNGAQPCQYQSVIAEFTANSSSSTPSMATSASPYEVRRILTMGLPFTSGHGGQILFGPTDGYLYFMMGDGGNKGDPFNFAQNKKSLLGKILRIDINNIPSQSKIDDLDLWGNYSIPKDNPFTDGNELQSEIWALGLRNPWRCSFDSKRPSYFYCADTGQDTYEEVDLISKGGNYGWRVYEGPNLFHPPSTPGGNTSATSINAIFPIMGYPHSDLNNSVGSASITGGYVYRSMTDPCLYGRYLYADLYAGAMWVGTESPESSGNYSSNMIPFSCSSKSPVPCDTVAGTSLPSIGYVFSFGEDNNKDVYVMTSKGIYRIVRPSRCNFSCPKEYTTDEGNEPPGPSSAGRSTQRLSLLVFFLLLLLSS